MVERAAEIARGHVGWELSKTTLLYLALERGRCLLALGRPAEALPSFERVRDAYRADADYPRTGAMRGLAAAWRAIGEHAKADDALRACLAVAQHGPQTIRQVAAMALGDVLLLAPEESGVARGDLEQAWVALFPGATSREAVAQILARWIY
jgi:tetratricopeptide (TPR) repeat protein